MEWKKRHTSSKLPTDGEMLAIMTVRQLPPSES
jgi:hypothetical protein